MADDLYGRMGAIFGAAYSKKSNPVLTPQVITCDDYLGTPVGAMWAPPVEDAVIVEEEYDFVESPSFG